MSRILVVYYSRTGHTRRVAEEVAQRLGADAECVQDSENRAGIWGYLRSLSEALQRRTIDIAAGNKDPGNYDLVVLGTPVWAHMMSSPLRSYIANHRGRLKAIAVLCTQGGSGGGSVVAQVAELCGRVPVAQLVLSEREINSQRNSVKLDEFIEAVGKALPP